MDKASNDNQHTKIQIGFPQTDQDSRLQLIDINGSIFALVFSALESNGPIKLDCSDWSLILLAPIKSKKAVEITGINVICLNEIDSGEDEINVRATNKLVKFAHSVKESEKIVEVGESGKVQFPDDPGAYMYYYRLFETILVKVKEGTPEALAEAQQQFIMGLCTLADKVEGKTEDLNVARVLDLWKINHREN